MFKYNIVLFTLLIAVLSCKTQESVNTKDSNSLNGRWDVKFYLNSIEQPTQNPYYWQLGADSSYTFSNQIILTQNNLISLDINRYSVPPFKYKIIPFKDFQSQSLDYAYILRDLGVSENDSKYFFDIGSYKLQVNYSGQFGFTILGIPFAVKSFEPNLIILFPLVSNKSFEIRLTKSK